MNVHETAARLRLLENMLGSVRNLIAWAQSIEVAVPGLLDSLFTTAEQSGTVNVRNKIQAEIARIEALEVLES